MGMYTGLRCKVKLKSEFVLVIQRLLETGNWSDLGYDFLDQFSSFSRADFIPFGDLSYMPDEWESEEALKEWDNRIENGCWIFQCSLKNYDDTIEEFFNTVLPHIVTEVNHLEYFYEEMESSVFYELLNGEIVESEREGIIY